MKIFENFFKSTAVYNIYTHIYILIYTIFKERKIDLKMEV